MKISVDSNDLPQATRLATWRGMVCDTFMGMDCRFARDDFRSSVKGHAVGLHKISRVKSTAYVIDRSRTLINRDGLAMACVAISLAGRAVVEHAGRESVLEPGTITLGDSSRPFRRQADDSADAISIGIPLALARDRIRCFEDLVAIPIVPAKSITPYALGVLAGLDEATASGAPSHVSEGLVIQFVELLAMTLMSSSLFPARTFSFGRKRRGSG